MTRINKDVEKLIATVQKQINYLSGKDSNNFFSKNNYRFNINNDTFSINLLKEEQASGSCWSDGLFEPKYFHTNNKCMISAIKVVLSAILIKKKGADLKDLTRTVFSAMSVKKHTSYGYYGNYEKYENYSIKIEDIYSLVDDAFPEVD